MQQTGLRRSKSLRERSRSNSYTREEKLLKDMKGTGSPRIRQSSMSELQNMKEDLFEIFPLKDVYTDTQTKIFASNTADEVLEPLRKSVSVNTSVNNLDDTSTDNSRNRLFNIGNAVAGAKSKSYSRGDNKVQQMTGDEKSELSMLSSINEKHIDNLTADNEEVIRSSNTQLPGGIPKSKSTDSVGEGKIKKSGVQLKRCLSLYDRKRNPHFCKDNVYTEKKEYTNHSVFGQLVNDKKMREDKLKHAADCGMRRSSDKLPRPKNATPIKTNSDLQISKLPNANAWNIGKVNKMPGKSFVRTSIGSDLSEDLDETSTITSVTTGSLLSSTISLESDTSSELDFDALIPRKLGTTYSSYPKSPQQSLIPVPIRPRSATLCLSDNIIKDSKRDILDAFKQVKQVKRSISLYEKRISSFSNGSSVSIKIRESVRSLSSSDSSSGSADEVFSTSPKSTYFKAKAVDVPEDEDGYPDPAPPSKSRSDVFNPREYVQVDEHALKAPASLASSFDDLLAYLVKDLTSDLPKVRAIYRWIVSQTIPLTLSRHDVVDDSPLGFLYNIRERRASYSELMAVMCRKAGIQCVIIHGVAKGLAYDVGDKVTPKKMSNTWNAVYTEGSWRFIHPYWASQAARGYNTGRWAVTESDAFHVDGQTESTQQLVQRLNDFYFLTDPEKFITKCFPDDPEWQLLGKHITKSEFEALPFLQPTFYELKLKTRSHNQCVIHAEHGKVELSLALPKEKAKVFRFRYKLLVHRDWEAEGEYDVILLDRYLLYYHEGNTAIFEIRFPVSGIYKLELHCSDPKKQLPSDWVCDYKIICKKPMEICNPLPTVPSIGWGLGEELINAGLECLTHSEAIISLDKETVTFVRFALPKDKEMTLEAELIHNDKSASEMQSHVVCDQDGEHATIQISPPSEGEYALRVYTRTKDSGKGDNVCNFLMHRTKIIEDPELSDIRQSLITATDDGDVETLAYWVDRFTEKGMTDRGDLIAAKKKLQLAKLNRDIAEAIARKDLDLLERTMNSISGTSLKRQLGHVTAEAEAMRSRLRRLKRLRHAVLEMDQKTISEMRSYPKPPQAVHGVMAATFLLLGNKESELKKWTRVQGLISKRGKDGLKRRVAEFSSSKITPAVLKRAKDILNKYDLEAVQIASAGAATFYQWAVTMVGEAENDLEKAY